MPGEQKSESNSQSSSGASSSSEVTASVKAPAIVAIFVLATIIGGGLFWLFVLGSGAPVGAGWYVFAFAAGLSMIVLPCTLPLVFVIVPLSMGKGFMRGIGMALSFSAGVSIMLSMYGVLAAILGKAIFGFSEAEVIKNWFYFLAGIFAIAFALGQLGFLKVRMPTYSGAAPMFIQKQQEYLKAFLLGLFLGNIGVGCPHPATPVLLGKIATSGDIFYGWLLFFVHAIGRITPLLLLALLAVFGVNATSSLLKHREKIEKATAWGMVFVGGFLFTLGFFTHDWWVNSGTHSLFESIVQEKRFTGIIADRLNTGVAHAHGVETGTSLLFGLPLWLGNWILVALWVIPIWWYYIRELRRIKLLTDEIQKKADSAVLGVKKWFFLALTLLLGIFFIYIFPHNFLEHRTVEMDGHEEEGVPSVSIILKTDPSSPQAGSPTHLSFVLKDEKGELLRDLKIDHERILHVIIVSEDFTYFAHIHSEDAPATNIDEMVKNSAFSLNYVFPATGRYLVNVNFLHQTHEESKKFSIEVERRGTPTLTKDFSTKKLFEGYDVTLSTRPSKVIAGQSTTLRYRVERSDVPVTDMEAYLGAPMHIAIVSADLSSFVHTHGEIRDPVSGGEKHELNPGEVFGPEVETHVAFPYPGMYQVFGEFKHQGKVIVTRFLLEVSSGGGAPFSSQGH